MKPTEFTGIKDLDQLAEEIPEEYRTRLYMISAEIFRIGWDYAKERNRSEQFAILGYLSDKAHQREVSSQR